MTLEKVRVSIGSASVLGLISQKFKDPTTTCYVMTYIPGHCIANCSFCPQARAANSSSEKLSRVSWPIFPFKEFLTKLKYTSPLGKFQRICIQVLNYPENFQDLTEIVSQINAISNIPISTAIPPMSKKKLEKLRLIGVQRVGIALDGATKEVFEKIKGKEVKGPYDWDSHHASLKEAREVFPKGMVSTHLIFGLGESQKEFIVKIKELKDLNILVSLFSFTPIKGTQLESIEQPPLLDYRKMQLARYLLYEQNQDKKDFAFNSKGEVIHFRISKKQLRDIIELKNAFNTIGCPGCNRPYYTSRPSGPIYNYPRKLKPAEKEEIYDQLERFVG